MQGCEHVTALLIGKPAEVQFVVVAEEGGPLRPLGSVTAVVRASISGSASSGQRKPDPRVEQEVEHHLRPVHRDARQ